MSNLLLGARYLILGLGRLTTPGLKRYIILPILFNIIVLAFLLFLFYYYIFGYSHYLTEHLPPWLDFFSSIVFIILIISAVFLLLSLFMVLLNIIAAPFNGLLAEKTQTIFYDQQINSQPFLKVAVRSLRRQFQFLGYFFLRLLGMGILFLVPFIHPFYPFLWFLFTAWMLSVQYQDFVMDNNLHNFQEMLEKIRLRRSLSLGFGVAIHLLSFIPLLNIFIMPAAVIGSVMMYCDENKNSLLIV
jgi:CysZ protein